MELGTGRLAALRVMSDDSAALADRISMQVSLLRLQGVSWTAIGAALRVSRQAAQQRYGSR